MYAVFGEELAETGIGRPITTGVNHHLKDDPETAIHAVWFRIKASDRRSDDQREKAVRRLAVDPATRTARVARVYDVRLSTTELSSLLLSQYRAKMIEGSVNEHG